MHRSLGILALGLAALALAGCSSGSAPRSDDDVVIPLDSATFEQAIAGPGAVLVDFWADW